MHLSDKHNFAHLCEVMDSVDRLAPPLTLPRVGWLAWLASVCTVHAPLLPHMANTLLASIAKC
jgi:hypothetical protein